MARNSTGIVVAGLTAAALAVVGVLAVQASAAKERDDERRAKPSPSAPASPDDSATGEKDESKLPVGTGEGKRVVYSLKADRVWLVGKDGTPGRTFEVTPGTVDPPAGNYRVTSRSGHVTGTDGVPIENVVRFADVGGVSIGFSAAIDGSTPNPDPSRKTGGVREDRPDGEAMWLFATLDTRVVVVD
ncbi:hypothetical protein JGS22_004205 [Streptomyces sp. P38-E01]|uniref:Secreted protein n=1 Tax=Streptomyces tardus TaxID=2780544 RepID=A0A949JMH6_9ACTN|nr:hypothetical protein [Streptomyces tardus]MBU7596860.1 hypothetical protein [Streptomyces tardus]